MKKLFKNIVVFILSKYNYELVHRGDREINKKNFLSLYNYLEMVIEDGISHEYKTSRKRGNLLYGQLGTQAGEALYIVNALRLTRKINDSAICEFGVAQGQTSCLIANEMLESNDVRTLHLFDSFMGLSKPTKEDELLDDIYQLGSMSAYEGRMSYGKDFVIQKLDALGFEAKKYEVHCGYVNMKFLSLHLPSKVSFAYIDFDLYRPIKDTLDMLSERLVTGSIVMIDDYGFFSSGVEKAVQEHIDEQRKVGNEYELELPSKRIGYFALLHKR